MPVLTWAAHHRIWALGIGVAILLAAVATGVWFFLLRSPGTQVDLRQALRLYRQGQHTDIGGTSTDLPPPGVYRYKTTGGEQLSFGGINRAFPSVSQMIVDDGSCAAMKWEPLEQHTEGLVECRKGDGASTGAISIASAQSYEQIAGTQTTSIITCPAGTYLVPPHPTTGQRWRTTCHSSGQKVVFSGDVVGMSSVVIGRRNIPALHTRLTLSFSGSQSGTNPNDYWISPRNGLVLQQRETVDVSQKAGPLGSVRYTEQMAITLTSLAPTR